MKKRMKRNAKKTMRKTMRKTIFTLLFLTLSVSIVFLLYFNFFAAGDKGLSGEWSAQLDMTEQASVIALIWLQDIEAVSLSLEDMESYMQDLTVQVDLTLEQSGRTKGTFHCEILPESYEVCQQAAYEAFAIAFQDLLVERLHMTGYTGDTDREALEALVTETFGMSTVSYLMSYGPDLLPSLEDLQAKYEGSGTFEVTEDVLTRQFDSGQPAITKSEYYFRNDTNLILSEGTDSGVSGFFSNHSPMIYALKQPQ